MRKRLREQIRIVQAGGTPVRAEGSNLIPIPTYGGDTVLKIPQSGQNEEAPFLSDLAHAFIEIQYQADDMEENERIQFVQQKLVELETQSNG